MQSPETNVVEQREKYREQRDQMLTVGPEGRRALGRSAEAGAVRRRPTEGPLLSWLPQSAPCHTALCLLLVSEMRARHPKAPEFWESRVPNGSHVRAQREAAKLNKPTAYNVLHGAVLNGPDSWFRVEEV